MPNPDVLRALFTADCSLIIERDGAVSWCDVGAADLLGLQVGHVLGWGCASRLGLFFPDATTELRFEDFPLGRVLTGESIENAEVCVRGPRTHGEDVWLSVSAEAVFSSTLDDVVAALVLCHDITDRKKALHGLEDAHATLQALVQASPLPILALQPDGRISFWNRAAEKVFGWTQAEVYGKPLPFVPEERKDESIRMRARDLAGEIVLNREIRRHRKDGSLVDLTVSTAPIRDRTGALTGTICVYTDVTERRQFEERLRQSAKLESLGTLAGGIAHDFNNLLTSILGHTSLALEEALPGSDQATALATVMSTVDRAAALTSQLLAYAGHGRFRAEPLNLSALVEDLMPLIQSNLGSGVILERDLTRDLPPIEADSDQVRQVVVNLILNAREALPESGTVWLRTGEARLEEYGHCCFIEVRDNGCGMDKSTQDRIFDPFFTTKFTGRGLGLAAVLGIVRWHKGSIRVISELGEGSCFLVYLPVSIATGDQRI